MTTPTENFFSSDLWMRALEEYGKDTHLSVKLFDANERVVFGPIHSTPLFRLFDERGYDPGIFAECARRCLAQSDSRSPVLVSQFFGLTVVGTSLVLEGKIVGAAVGGYAFVDFSQISEIQRLAKDAGIEFERLWRVAREQKPIPQQRLVLNGELLQVLGDALLRENQRTRQYQETAMRLEEALRDRKRAEEALQRAHDELESLVQRRTASLRRLSSHLHHVQDEERRRIARDLHDSAGQYLAALKMNLAQLDRPDLTNANVVLAESNQLVDTCLAEIRTISYLLHPPLLDESGLASAATWYVEGFTKRSGIQTDLQISSRLERLSSDIEIVLFRALQESLTNVHRHSQSAKVEVRIELENGQVNLTVRDYGRGITPHQLETITGGSDFGVGLTGMRERVNELGGTFEVVVEKPGTTVRVTLPVARAESRTAHATENSAGRQSAA